MKIHPEDADLALLAGGDCSRVARFFLARHIKSCRDCAGRVEAFRNLRLEISLMREPALNWDGLAAEMRANIRLGLEAGACVRTVPARRAWNPRLTVAFASLSFLLCAGLLMRSPATLPKPLPDKVIGKDDFAGRTSTPVLEATGSGLELTDGSSSITLINRSGSLRDQSVSAQGGISHRNIEGGAVTFTNVSLE